MVRLIVTSKTYQMSSRASRSATERDPANLRLSHFPVRRLEAEAIRDSILAVSGRLDETRYGPGVSGRSRRRSLYVRVPRNELDPFLNVFDAPEPLTTRGRRDTTNVPAQSLTLLNDPWVLEQARAWGETIARDNPGAEDGPVIDRLFATALGRPPTPEERAECRRYLAEQDRRREEARSAAKRLETEIANRRARTAALTGPVRARLQARTKTGDHRVSRSMPVPIARWEFDTDFRDSIGTLHGEPQGNPRLENGGLVLDGSSSVPTARLDRPLSEKTLEAWVVLSDLDQRGGGVMSVETIGGGAFDAIVFGELAPREWLAGSNFFQRTKPFQGPPESEAAERPVPLAFVYRADGTIVGYRDGKPYGLDYRTDGPFRFEAGTSHVVFGLRHSPPGGNKMLKGRIARAQLYDRALSAEEVAASAGTHAEEVPEADVIAALDRPERAEFDRLKQEMISFTLTAERQRLETPRDEASGPSQRWGDLGHALFNLKEFLYVR